jgi:hypothetical protein
LLWVLLSYPAKTLILGGGFRNRRCWQNGWHANALSTIICKPVADSTPAWQEGVLLTFEEVVPPTIRLATECSAHFSIIFSSKTLGFCKKGSNFLRENSGTLTTS